MYKSLASARGQLQFFGVGVGGELRGDNTRRAACLVSHTRADARTEPIQVHQARLWNRAARLSIAGKILHSFAVNIRVSCKPAGTPPPHPAAADFGSAAVRKTTERRAGTLWRRPCMHTTSRDSETLRPNAWIFIVKDSATFTGPAS